MKKNVKNLKSNLPYQIQDGQPSNHWYSPENNLKGVFAKTERGYRLTSN